MLIARPRRCPMTTAKAFTVNLEVIEEGPMTNATAHLVDRRRQSSLQQEGPGVVQQDPDLTHDRR